MLYVNSANSSLLRLKKFNLGNIIAAKIFAIYILGIIYFQVWTKLKFFTCRCNINCNESFNENCNENFNENFNEKCNEKSGICISWMVNLGQRVNGIR